MGGAEGFVQVQVDHIEPGVADTHFAQDGIEVGPVIIEQCIHLVDHADNLFQMILEQSQGVGAGHHDCGGLFVENTGQDLGIDDAVHGFDGDHLISANGCGSGVGAVGRVRHDDLGLVVVPVPVIGRNEHDPGEFAVGSCQGLVGEGFHAGDFTEQLLGFEQHLQGALGVQAGTSKLRDEWMQPGKPRESGYLLHELGIVLHGA